MVWFFNGGLKKPDYGAKCPPSHATLTFEYRTPILSGIKVFSIQTVTVISFLVLSIKLFC